MSMVDGQPGRPASAGPLSGNPDRCSHPAGLCRFPPGWNNACSDLARDVSSVQAKLRPKEEMIVSTDNLAEPLQAHQAMFLRLVLPLDGSLAAEQALPHAEALAQHLDAPLHLVRVIDPLQPGAPLASLLALDALALEVWLEGERVAARE